MDFFNQCQTKEETKKLFKKLCKCFHPDREGDDELMIELKRQYDGWNPSNRIEGNEFNSSIVNMYEKRIHDLTVTIYDLRNQIDSLKITNTMHEVHSKEERNYRLKMEQEIKAREFALNQHLEEERNRLRSQMNTRDSMTLIDKLRFVFGYE